MNGRRNISVKNRDMYDIENLKLVSYTPYIHLLKDKKSGEMVASFRVDKLDDNITVNVFNQFKKWLDEECDPLDHVERKYLRAVIRPFIHKIDYIVKEESDYNEFIEESSHNEFIIIMMKDSSECITFPKFEKGTMYKGMELYRKYSLSELKLY